MILVWMILILMAGGILAWIAGKTNGLLSRWISLLAVAIDFIISIGLWWTHKINLTTGVVPQWMEEIDWNWIPQFGIHFHLALDGLSLLLILLTMFLGLLSVLASWKSVDSKVGFFHFNLLWILSGITGVFLSMDLFLFYFFWEVMLIPMYFLIAIWGYQNRIYAAYKFFIFTQASGLLMFLSILALYFIHGHQTAEYTFEYGALLQTQVNPTVAFWLMLGFLIAFAVKLPIVPLHNWLPDAHTQAPTAGSVILAGLLLKTGAYGIIRFAIPFFPQAAADFAPIAMFLGVVSIIYGAVLAFAQTDFKRLVAYTSVSHMGFVMLGAFAFNELAYQGVVMQMLTHGISTGALFIIVGAIYERIHSRDMDQMSGFWKQIPVMSAIGLLFAMASLGLPGLGNFVAEFLILLGSFQVSILWTVLATLGLVASSIYALRMMQKVFYGKPTQQWQLKDLNGREMIIMAAMIIVIVWLGLFPDPVLNTAKTPLKNILSPIEVYQQSSMKEEEQKQEAFILSSKDDLTTIKATKDVRK